MPDRPGFKGPSIPAWQTQSSQNKSDTTSKTSKHAEERTLAQDRNSIVEQARTFLEDPSVQNASQEKKIAFLEKKGLQGDEIQKLLGTALSSEEDSSLKTIHESSTSSSSDSSCSTPEAPPSISSSPQAKSASQSKPDIPPIITYPEFLYRPTKPPPLITFERLSYTLYTLAGISALTYGASKHLIQPMLQSLTSARHDLASTALHNLEKLNEKLEGNVSHIPAMSNSVLLKERERKQHLHDNESDVESIDSGPTELFHRDIATQTSPRLTRTPSLASSTSSTPSHSPSPLQTKDTTTTAQSTRLTNLSKSLTSLLSSSTSTSTAQDHLLSTISDCQSYLDKLQYSMNSYSDYNLLYGSAPPAVSSKDDNKSRSSRGKAAKKEGGGRDGEEEDEAMRFRQEIRSVKGALLSVRNFPVGKPATGGVLGQGVGVR